MEVLVAVVVVVLVVGVVWTRRSVNPQPHSALLNAGHYNPRKVNKMASTAVTDKTVLDRYMRLPIPDNKCQAMYVWVDGTGEHLRSKTRTVNFHPQVSLRTARMELRRLLYGTG
ncbi:hypothetical protein O3P69_012140 [Scylla paramamosain]|uniref:Glutamine synthetase n=1 Tax=Scylla paramamosain TaxID=85552 RepID=A0AAW0TCR4_SCYPA